MEHILQPSDIKTIGRPIGKVADEKINAFITEAEQLHIKPILGDEVFLKLFDESAKNEEKLAKLLNGGTYMDKRGKVHSFMGLKVALSYFVYAQNLMSGDIESTRFGSVMKNDDFSTRISSKERSDAYNNAIDVAKAYMQECVAYCREMELIASVGRTQYHAGGVTICKIGK